MLVRGGYLGMRRCLERSAAPARRSPFEPEVLGSLLMLCSTSRECFYVAPTCSRTKTEKIAVLPITAHFGICEI